MKRDNMSMYHLLRRRYVAGQTYTKGSFINYTCL